MCLSFIAICQRLVMAMECYGRFARRRGQVFSFLFIIYDDATGSQHWCVVCVRAKLSTANAGTVDANFQVKYALQFRFILKN